MKNMKKLMSALLTLAMLFSMAACGGKSPSGTSGTQTDGNKTPDIESAAEVDPAEIDWGYQSSDSMDTQYWYAGGVKNASSFIFFEDDMLTFVEGTNRETFDTVTLDYHIVDYDTEGEQFDFVFTDALTCYDYVSECWYMRSDMSVLTESLTAADFICEAGDEWKYTFREDGTLTYENDGETEEGTWWITDARTLHSHLESEAEGAGGWMEIVYKDDSWEVEYLEDMDKWYPENE